MSGFLYVKRDEADSRVCEVVVGSGNPDVNVNETFRVNYLNLFISYLVNICEDVNEQEIEIVKHGMEIKYYSYTFKDYFWIGTICEVDFSSQVNGIKIKYDYAKVEDTEKYKIDFNIRPIDETKMNEYISHVLKLMKMAPGSSIAESEHNYVIYTYIIQELVNRYNEQISYDTSTFDEKGKFRESHAVGEHTQLSSELSELRDKYDAVLKENEIMKEKISSLEGDNMMLNLAVSCLEIELMKRGAEK